MIIGNNGNTVNGVSSENIISGNNIDYTESQGLGSGVLAIELFHSCTRSIVSDNIIIGNALTTIFAGISIADSDYCKAQGNYVQDVTVGIENAGCSYTTIENNTIKRFISGIPVSGSGENWNRGVIIKGNLLDTNLDTSKYSIQIVGVGSNISIEGNKFIDYGAIGIFFNGVGSNSMVTNNEFNVRDQSTDMEAISLLSVDNIKISNNSVIRNIDGNTSRGQQACVVNNSDNIYLNNNYFDGRSADNSTRTTVNGVVVVNNSNSFYCIGNYISNYDNNGIFGGGNTGSPAYFYLNRFRNCTHHLAKRSGDVSHQNGGI